MFHPAHRRRLFAILLLLNSGSAVNNNATESSPPLQPAIPQHRLDPDQTNQNQASSSGTRLAASHGSDQRQMACRELRSTKYISDGQCTSINPIKELVCAGECLPAHLLPNWIRNGGYAERYWSRRNAQEWRCIIDRTRTQRVWLQCEDGNSRTYKITVVTSCKCKRFSREQNDSGHKDTPVNHGKHRKNERKAVHSEERSLDN